MCQQIAAAGQGTYVRCDNTNTAMRALQQELDQLATAEIESTIYADYNEQYQSFLLIALLLLSIEFFIMTRKNHRLTRMNLFGEK
jgi:Ca-activated chloride channel family protein